MNRDTDVACLGNGIVWGLREIVLSNHSENRKKKKQVKVAKLESHILYDSNYRTFWNMNIHRNNKNGNFCQSLMSRKDKYAKDV